MLIIGSTQLTYTKNRGSFHCPRCNQEQPFRHRRKREFLTLYFIPVLPLQLVSEFVECGTCRSTFDLQIASMSAGEIRASQRQNALEMIRRVLVVIVAADDQVSENELSAVTHFARQYELPVVSADQIMREAAAVRQAQVDLRHYISYVAQQLTREDRELLIYHGFLAATAGGDLSPARQQLLQQLPAAVGVPEDRFREIIVRAVEA